MLKFGTDDNILECSSKGDKRFSAFYAKPLFLKGKSIEQAYQGKKIFNCTYCISLGCIKCNNYGILTKLTPNMAKGKEPINPDDCRKFYTYCWKRYFVDNPELFTYAKTFTGFSDIFGQKDHACQAEEIYNLTTKNPMTFVFGSNLSGIHGAGAAKAALEVCGAEPGNGEGPQGKSFAIPTKDKNLNTLPLEEIQIYIESFIEFAKKRPEKEFLVTKIGCGLAGYQEEQISPMFIQAKGFKNILLPQGW